MQDLSSLAKDSLWVTSQEGGNMMSGRPAAMSAPGSPPVTPLPPTKDQGTPKVTMSGPEISPGDTGKPEPKTTWNPPKPSWGKPAIPDVSRTPDQ